MKVRERSRISNHTDVSAACWLLPDALSSRHKCKSISDRTSDFLNKEETEPQKKIKSCKPSSSNIYYEIIYYELFSGFFNKCIEIVFWIIFCSSHSVASASSRPARSPERGHPLCLPLLPHLRLHPHCHLPSPRRLPRCWGDQAHPGQGAHGLRSHGARGDEAAVLSHNCSQKML